MAENQKPTVGRIVHYTLSEQDAGNIELRRIESKLLGNQVKAGDEVAAIIVAVWSETCVNLRCFLDGEDTFWGLSRSPSSGPVPGAWHWPERA